MRFFCPEPDFSVTADWLLIQIRVNLWLFIATQKIVIHQLWMILQIRNSLFSHQQKHRMLIADQQLHACLSCLHLAHQQCESYVLRQFYSAMP